MVQIHSPDHSFPLSYRLTPQLLLAFHLSKLVPTCPSTAVLPQSEVRSQDLPWLHILAATGCYRATACRNAPTFPGSRCPSKNRSARYAPPSSARLIHGIGEMCESLPTRVPSF